MITMLRNILVLLGTLTIASGAATAAPILFSFGPLAFMMPFIMVETGSLSGDLEFDPMTGEFRREVQHPGQICYGSDTQRETVLSCQITRI